MCSAAAAPPVHESLPMASTGAGQCKSLPRHEHFFLVGIRRETREWKRRISPPVTGAYGRKQTTCVHIRFVQPPPGRQGSKSWVVATPDCARLRRKMAFGVGDLPLHFPLVRVGPERSLFVAKGVVHGGGGRRLNEGRRRRAGSEMCRSRPRPGRTAVLAVYGTPRPPKKILWQCTAAGRNTAAITLAGLHRALHPQLRGRCARARSCGMQF